MPLVPRTWRVDTELDLMSGYLEYLSSHIKGQHEDLVNQIEEMAKELDYEEKHDLYDHFSDALSQLERDFPRLLYSSFVMSWYSFVETSLLRICDEYNLKIEMTAQDRDISDTGIYRARRFLREAADYEIDGNHWQELRFINLLRNKLVHERGKIPTYGSKPIGDDRNYEAMFVIEGFPFYVEIEHNLFAYLQRFALLTYQGPTFVLDPSLAFSKHLIEFAHELFHRIYGDLEKNRSI